MLYKEITSFSLRMVAGVEGLMANINGGATETRHLLLNECDVLLKCRWRIFLISRLFPRFNGISQYLLTSATNYSVLGLSITIHIIDTLQSRTRLL